MPWSKRLPSISTIFLIFPLLRIENKQDFLKKKSNTLYYIKINMYLRKDEESNFLFVNASNQCEKKIEVSSKVWVLEIPHNQFWLQTLENWQALSFLIAIQQCIGKKAISMSAYLAVVIRLQWINIFIET